MSVNNDQAARDAASQARQEAMMARQEKLQEQNFINQMKQQELQQKSHQDQQLIMGLSNIDKGNDDAMKTVAGNLK